ncbi:MAG TPA: hypothetical protein VK651_01195, partial [Blastocatellia bacterium]|nr:hypothetical protein [Blastocatellia bacterium]
AGGVPHYRQMIDQFLPGISFQLSPGCLPEFSLVSCKVVYLLKQISFVNCRACIVVCRSSLLIRRWVRIGPASPDDHG